MKQGLKLDNVSFAYDGQTEVLKGICAHIKPGSFFGIIGPNGAGKTTLIRLISGYLQPQKGRITLDGNDIRTFSHKQIARRMALVPQFSGMEYDFTVKDIVLTGRFAHMSRFKPESLQDYAIASEAMERAGIAQLRDRSILTLSGGEWQRMIIARALCQQSDMILLDEPVSNLDIRHQVELLKTIRAFVLESGLTAVAVLHDLSLAWNFCDTLLLLHNGGVYRTGSPDTVLTQQNIEAVYGISVQFACFGEHTYVLPRL